jgi:uncharacterized protein (DUF1800 family)
VDGGYTQKDVVEVARCFTGWTIDKNNPDNPFVFDPKMPRQRRQGRSRSHHSCRRNIRSRTVIEILAHQPATARFIATKLARRFVADDPPASLVKPRRKGVHRQPTATCAKSRGRF